MNEGEASLPTERCSNVTFSNRLLLYILNPLIQLRHSFEEIVNEPLSLFYGAVHLASRKRVGSSSVENTESCELRDVTFFVCNLFRRFSEDLTCNVPVNVNVLVKRIEQCLFVSVVCRNSELQLRVVRLNELMAW